MYDVVLFLHSWLRWVVLALGVLATFGALMETGVKPAKTGLIFTIALDLQVLLGLLLYFGLSPITAVAFHDFGAAMRDPLLRFWAVEHAATMLLAVIFAHVGNVLAKKATTPESRRARQIIWFSLATVAMIARTPWPGLAGARPLFRLP
jgi:hypothetical protein